MAFSKKEKTFTQKEIVEMVRNAFKETEQSFLKAEEDSKNSEPFLEVFFMMIQLSVIGDLTRAMDKEGK